MIDCIILHNFGVAVSCEEISKTHQSPSFTSPWQLALALASLASFVDDNNNTSNIQYWKSGAIVEYKQHPPNEANNVTF